jgi:hypothetical protein
MKQNWIGHRLHELLDKITRQFLNWNPQGQMQNQNKPGEELFKQKTAGGCGQS